MKTHDLERAHFEAVMLNLETGETVTVCRDTQGELTLGTPTAGECPRLDAVVYGQVCNQGQELGPWIKDLRSRGLI